MNLRNVFLDMPHWDRDSKKEISCYVVCLIHLEQNVLFT